MTTKFLIACAILAATAFAQSSLSTDPAYAKNCAKCHGKTAEGRHPFGGPSLLTTQLSLDEVKAVILNGKNKMPAFAGKLRDDQVFAIAAEIKDLSKNAPQK